jgi:hypothetical protein
MGDTYEEKQMKMAGLSKEETSRMLNDIKKVCNDYCGVCPSHAGTGERELAFCATQKSRVIKDENGCMCSGCPITEKMSYRWEYYCTRGSAREQAVKK